MSKPIILISNRMEDRVFTESVARFVGLSLNAFNDFDSASTQIKSGNFSGIFVFLPNPTAFQAFETAIQHSVGVFSDMMNPNLIHVLCPDDISILLPNIHSPLFGNFIRTQYGDPAEAGLHYGRMVKASLSNRIFGLENYFDGSVKIQKIALKLTGQKQEAVEAVRNFLVSAKFKQRMANQIANATDELLMNAMFDAPVDAFGKHIYETTPRSENLVLDGQSRVELQIAFDGKYIGLCAVDLFGSLVKEKLLSAVCKRFSGEEYQIRLSRAGAGIGLSNIFQGGGSLYFACEKSSRTEAVVFYKKVDNHRKFKDQFQFVSTQFLF